MPSPCHRAADPGPRERGQVTVWMLGLAVMLLFLGGLSLDLWRAFTQRQNLAIGNLRSQAVFPRLDTAQVNATEAQVEVVATTTVQFTLLRVLLPNDRPFTVRVRAVSIPRESGT